MGKRIFLKALCSVPIILVALYFMPILGVGLIILRYCIGYQYDYYDRYYDVPVELLICGILIVIPKAADYIIGIFKIQNFEISNLNNIVTSEFYISLLSFSKRLIIIGIITTIIIYIILRIRHMIKHTMNSMLEGERKIAEKNDLKMREKQERAKNTHFVKCPNCGATNVINGNVGTCQFCRNTIEYKQ